MRQAFEPARDRVLVDLEQALSRERLERTLDDSTGLKAPS